MVFERDETRRYFSLVYRDDGVVLRMPGYDRKWRVPHDLTHVAVERELGMARGVLGSIAAGVVFPNMEVVSGRLKHDAKRRSERLARENGAEIGVAELLVGVVHDAVERRDRTELVARAHAAWGSVHEEPFPYPDSALLAAADALDDMSARWTGRTFEVEWPQPPRAMRRTSRASSS